MNTKSLLVLSIIVISLIPVYLINKQLQVRLRPRESLGRLFLYLLAGLALVFGYTFLIVFVIKRLFPGA